jgi:predicted chitinase
MGLSIADLKNIMPDADVSLITRVIPYLDKYMAMYRIDEPVVIAAFIATVAEETGEFVVFNESFNYSYARAKDVFGNRVNVTEKVFNEYYFHRPTLFDMVYSNANQVGRDVVLEPATIFDMVGKNEVIKPTLEVIYDKA